MTKNQKQKPQWAARKKAFDETMACYRQGQDTGMGAIPMTDAGKGSLNPARPNITDFRVDVERIINHCVTTQDMIVRFRACYINFDSENPIDNERYADKVIGSMRHGLEQGIGALFIKHGIYPLHEKGGYFHSVRQPRGRV